MMGRLGERNPDVGERRRESVSMPIIEFSKISIYNDVFIDSIATRLLTCSLPKIAVYLGNDGGRSL